MYLTCICTQSFLQKSLNFALVLFHGGGGVAVFGSKAEKGCSPIQAKGQGAVSKVGYIVTFQHANTRRPTPFDGAEQGEWPHLISQAPQHTRAWEGGAQMHPTTSIEVQSRSRK